MSVDVFTLNLIADRGTEKVHCCLVLEVTGR